MATLTMAVASLWSCGKDLMCSSSCGTSCVAVVVVPHDSRVVGVVGVGGVVGVVGVLWD